MPIFLVIMLVLGGGASVSAANALPGDALYAVKVHVNEEVQGWLSLSDEAKANWETVLATRRLKEAEQLAAQSKLNTEKRAQLEVKFEDHANKAEARIEKLAKVDAEAAADIGAKLQTSLEAHDRILLDIGESKDGDVDIQVKSISSKVRAEVKDTLEDRNKNEAEVKISVDIEAAAQRQLNAAESKIAEVRKFIADKKDKLGADAILRIEAQLKIADDLVVKGKVQLDVKEYRPAFSLGAQAYAKAQEVKILVEAKLRLENQDERDKSDRDNIDRISVSPKPRISMSPLPPVKVQSETEVKQEAGSDSGRVKIDLDIR